MHERPGIQKEHAVSELLEGKVAQILSDKYIVIAIGALAGAKVGMTFVVLAQGEEVKDPATGAVLGRWELPKGYLRATHVQEKLTTCEGIPSPGRTPARPTRPAGRSRPR
jgi:hypothetical protein